MSSPWNRRPVEGPAPLSLVDATLAELPRRPPPEAAASWARRLAGLGVERVCAGNLDDSGWSEEWVRLVRNSSCRPVLEFNLTSPVGVRPRWFCSQSGLAVRLLAPSEGLLENFGFPSVTLAIPNAVAIDPITLGNWIRLAENYRYNRLEIIAHQGRPWGAGLNSLLQFVLNLADQLQVGWSCSDGLGLSLSQGMAAWQGGARFLRVCLAGLGGTIPLERVLPDQEFHEFASRYLGIPMPPLVRFEK